MTKRKIHLDFEKLIPSIIVGLLTATSFFIGVYFGGRGIIQNLGPIKFTPTQTVINKETGKPEEVDFSLFWEAWNELDRDYYQDVDYQKMLYGSIKGLAQSMGDPYTSYMDPDEAKAYLSEINGSFSGVGIEIAERNDLLVVISALKDTPAFEAGLRSKDVILKINNEDATAMTVDEAVSKIRGPEGSEVTLTIQRGKDVKDVKLTRRTINIKTVNLEEKQIGGKKIDVVKLSQFTEDSVKEFEDVTNQILLNNPDGIILDLRGNPGGYLESAISISSEMIDGGVVVIEEKRGGKRTEIKTNRSARLADKKIVVLIDQGSASASEIVAGALKDRGRAKLVGEKSFGKGLVQSVMDLKAGILKITTAKWLTPNGVSINEQGISPDTEVKMTDDDLNNFRDPQMDKALEIIGG